MLQDCKKNNIIISQGFAFKKVNGTTTMDNVTTRFIGIRYTDANETTLEFLQENGVRIKYNNFLTVNYKNSGLRS